MIFTVVETQEFVLEAADAEEANALVRDGVSHSKELLAASVSFSVMGRVVTDLDGIEMEID